MPFEHFIGRLCEEFPGALPSQVWREWQRLPGGFLETLIDYRHYAAAKRTYDATERKTALAMSAPVYQLVNDITFELVKEAIDDGRAVT